MRTKMFVILVVLLTAVSLFAQSDLDNPTPPTEAAPEVTPNPDGSEVYVQVINNAPGMWEYRWFNQDFDWTHTFDVKCVKILSATLEIAAWDVDYYYGERDVIYAEGVKLGELFGYDYYWYVTKFNVPVDLLSNGELKVFIDIDSTHTEYWWAVTIGWSKLTVTYEELGKDILERARKAFNDTWFSSFLSASIIANDCAREIEEKAGDHEEKEKAYKKCEQALQNLKNTTLAEYEKLRDYFYFLIDVSDLPPECKKELKEKIRQLMEEYKNLTTAQYQADTAMLWSIKQGANKKPINRGMKAEENSSRQVAWKTIDETGYFYLPPDPAKPQAHIFIGNTKNLSEEAEARTATAMIELFKQKYHKPQVVLHWATEATENKFLDAVKKCTTTDIAFTGHGTRFVDGQGRPTGDYGLTAVTDGDPKTDDTVTPTEFRRALHEAGKEHTKFLQMHLYSCFSGLADTGGNRFSDFAMESTTYGATMTSAKGARDAEKKAGRSPVSVLEFDEVLINETRKDIERLWHGFHGAE